MRVKYKTHTSSELPQNDEHNVNARTHGRNEVQKTFLFIADAVTPGDASQTLI